MHAGRTVLAQLMDLVPKHEFDKCVRRYGGDKHVRRSSCYGQFLAMCFAQLTGRDSLRDIEICLRAVGRKLYHAGLRGPVPRSTLADANEKRDWRIFADFAQVLIAQAARLYAGEPMGVELEGAAYALDSTTVDLCLGLFPWAKYKQTRGGVKMHTLLALRGNLPSLVVITPAHVHDVNVLAELAFEPGALYVMDRGYVDFAQFHRIHQAPAFFLTRAKRNLKFRRRTSAPVDKTAGVRFDQIGVLDEPTSRRRYPDTLRRVGYRDPETGKPLVDVIVDAAGQKQTRLAGRTHRHAAHGHDFGVVQIRVVANLHPHLRLRMVHVHPELRMRVQNAPRTPTIFS